MSHVNLDQESLVGDSTLTVKLSKSLIRKLQNKAQAEKVPVNEFVAELLGEGLVLRAWEIVERKNTMKGSPSAQGSSASHNRNHLGKPSTGRHFSSQHPSSSGHQRRHAPQGSSMPRRPSNYNAILEDSAHFMEYVRSQEKQSR